MDVASIAILTTLMGIVMGLVEVVKHLIVKKKQNGNGHLTPAQAEQLTNVSKFCTQFEVRWDYLQNDIRELKEEQATNNSQISKLIASQERVVERMIELIAKMDRVLERSN